MLTIAVSANVERLRERLQYGLRELERQGLRVVQKEQTRGEYTFVSVGVQGTPGHAGGEWRWQDILRRQLAAILCEAILSDFREVFLHRIVATRYPQLGTQERETVVRYAQRSLGDAGAREAFRRSVLFRLLEYMQDNRQLIVEGFITFRLKEYVEHLEEAVEKAIEEILLEKEYQEFVRLLQCFVATQQPRVAEIHVFCRETGLALEDADGRVISIQGPGTLDEGIRPEDLLVSGVVSLAPSRVIVHGVPAGDDDRAVVEAILNVFAGRTSICPGCPRCHSPAPVPPATR